MKTNTLIEMLLCYKNPQYKPGVELPLGITRKDLANLGHAIRETGWLDGKETVEAECGLYELVRRHKDAELHDSFVTRSLGSETLIALIGFAASLCTRDDHTHTLAIGVLKGTMEIQFGTMFKEGEIGHEAMRLGIQNLDELLKQNETPDGLVPSHRWIIDVLEGNYRETVNITAVTHQLQRVIIPPKDGKGVFSAMMVCIRRFSESKYLVRDLVTPFSTIIKVQKWTRFVRELTDDEMKDIFLIRRQDDHDSLPRMADLRQFCLELDLPIPE